MANNLPPSGVAPGLPQPPGFTSAGQPFQPAGTFTKAKKAAKKAGGKATITSKGIITIKVPTVDPETGKQVGTVTQTFDKGGRPPRSFGELRQRFLETGTLVDPSPKVNVPFVTKSFSETVGVQAGQTTNGKGKSRFPKEQLVFSNVTKIGGNVFEEVGRGGSVQDFRGGLPGVKIKDEPKFVLGGLVRDPQQVFGGLKESFKKTFAREPSRSTFTLKERIESAKRTKELGGSGLDVGKTFLFGTPKAPPSKLIEFIPSKITETFASTTPEQRGEIKSKFIQLGEEGVSTERTFLGLGRSPAEKQAFESVFPKDSPQRKTFLRKQFGRGILLSTPIGGEILFGSDITTPTAPIGAPPSATIAEFGTPLGIGGASFLTRKGAKFISQTDTFASLSTKVKTKFPTKIDTGVKVDVITPPTKFPDKPGFIFKGTEVEAATKTQLGVDFGGSKLGNVLERAAEKGLSFGRKTGLVKDRKFITEGGLEILSKDSQTAIKGGITTRELGPKGEPIGPPRSGRTEGFFRGEGKDTSIGVSATETKGLGKQFEISKTKDVGKITTDIPTPGGGREVSESFFAGKGGGFIQGAKERIGGVFETRFGLKVTESKPKQVFDIGGGKGLTPIEKEIKELKDKGLLVELGKGGETARVKKTGIELVSAKQTGGSLTKVITLGEKVPGGGFFKDTSQKQAFGRFAGDIQKDVGKIVRESKPGKFVSSILGKGPSGTQTGIGITGLGKDTTDISSTFQQPSQAPGQAITTFIRTPQGLTTGEGSISISGPVIGEPKGKSRFGPPISVLTTKPGTGLILGPKLGISSKGGFGFKPKQKITPDQQQDQDTTQDLIQVPVPEQILKQPTTTKTPPFIPTFPGGGIGGGGFLLPPLLGPAGLGGRRRRFGRRTKRGRERLSPSLIGISFPEKFKPISLKEARGRRATGIGIRPQIKGRSIKVESLFKRKKKGSEVITMPKRRKVGKRR